MICRMTALLFAAAVGVPASVRADIAGEPSTVHAITGVTIVSEPGADPVAGTIVLRDGRIELLGAGVTIPSDAVVHARPGRTVYAGLIEPYLRLSADSADSADSAAGGRGIADGNTRLRADVRAVDGLPVDAELLEEMRTAGYTANAASST